MKFTKSVRLLGAAAVASLFMVPAAQADSGFFVGGSLGSTTIKDDLIGGTFDENDSAWKGMAGYIFDLPAVDFGIELAYNDFGAPSGDVGGTEYELDATGISAYGTVGLDYGLFGFFGKVGFVQWDSKAFVDNVSAGSDDGTDTAYGIGFRLGFSSVEVRAEYEVFDVSDISDADMLSVGVIWRF